MRTLLPGIFPVPFSSHKEKLIILTSRLDLSIQSYLEHLFAPKALKQTVSKQFEILWGKIIYFLFQYPDQEEICNKPATVYDFKA